MVNVLREMKCGTLPLASHLSHVMLLHLNLNMFAFEPLDHKFVLLPWCKAGPHRLPRPPSTDAAVLRLRDADETFLRHGIDRMVVDFKPPFKPEPVRIFTGQRVGLMHRHEPTARKGLLRPVPEVGLIAGIDRNGPPVRPGFMALDRLGR